MTPVPPSLRRWSGARALIFAWVLGLGASGGPSAAGPIAGSAIVNQADGSGLDSLSGLGLADQSNVVRAIVQALDGLALVADRGVTAAPGSPVTFAHRLSNLGNYAEDYRLELANLGGDGFDLAGLALTQDRNGDGQVDAGDTPVALGGVVTLAPGASADLIVSADVPSAAPGLASALLRLTATGLARGTGASNTDTVRTPPVVPPPALAFYTANDYAQVARTARLAQPLYLEVAAPACDAGPASDSVRVLVASQLTGDREWFTAGETGAATGVFRVLPHVPTLDGAGAPAAIGDGALSTRRGDVVTATLYGCGAPSTEARVWIDPAGVVFDGRSNAPVAGARVALIDVLGAGNGGIPGGPAQVGANGAIATAPSEMVTDASGRFEFPRVQPSTYRLQVSPPAGYRFPSTVAPGALPPGHPIDPSGSYGGEFSTSLPDEPIRFDVPLDANSSVALFLEKRAGRDFAEVGDELDYTLSIANRGDSALAAVTLTDVLPAGFAYVPGSARSVPSAGTPERLADPAGGRGPRLAFSLAGLGARATATIRYRARVGPGALDGDGINRAVAASGTSISNTASAKVTVLGGVFADEATIVGSVFLDANRDRHRDAPEPGIAGVRLYLDDGTFAITDREGEFSFSGVTPRTHALKLDASTLPRGARLVALDHRQGASPGTRFVDLTRGELARADFAAAPAESAHVDSALLATLARRSRDPRLARGELERNVGRSASLLDPERPPGDPRAQPAAGVTTGERVLPLFAAGGEGASIAGGAGASERGAGPAADDAPAAPPGPSLEDAIASAGPQLEFIGLGEGDTLLARQIAVRVKGEAGLPFDLRVNGEEVPASRVGRKTALPARGIEAWEYVGVPLRPGVNVLDVEQTTPAGWVRDHASVRVVAPDRLARLELVVPAMVPADGHSTAGVRVRLVDRRGVPVTSSTVVTLESSLGRFEVEDVDAATPGLQTVIQGGERRIPLASPDEPGTARVRAAAAGLAAEAALDFTPELRPLLAVGTFEGVVNLSRFPRRAPLAAARPRTGFEAPLATFASERRDGRASAAAHGALFMKGRLRDDVLLTLGYDSDKPEGMRRFRDAQPDAFYPLYGDAAVRGYDAQSSGRLYARLDRRGASLLYGDFVTRGSGGERRLGGYSRSLTGVQTHVEDRRVTLDGFSSRDRARRRVEEIRGRGVSGPYAIAAAPFVENSERVEIVTRDRAQPAVVLRATGRARFVDYEIEPLTGRLVFKSPVPSLDADLNPVFIRVSVEVDGGGDPYWISGAEARVAISRRVSLGGSYVDDHDPGRPYELRSAFATAQLAPRTVLEAEVARSLEVGRGAGLGARFELRREDPGLEARLFGAATGERFSNPLAGFGAGRSEAGGRLSARLSARTRLNAEALFSADALGEERRGGLLASVDQTLSDAVRGELGLRVAGAARRAGAVPEPSLALRAKLSGQLPRHPSVSGYGELEQDVRERARRMAAVGGEYRFSARGRLYARHELLSSLTSAYALTASQRQLATVIGVDADLERERHVFGEYRVADALLGREAEAALGLRNAWRLRGGYRVGTSFERVSPLLGDASGPTTAVTGSLDYADGEACQGSTRIEVRSGRAGDGFLTTLAGACRLDRTWTLIMRNAISVTDERSRGNHARERLQFGFACRSPGADAWSGLGRYELRYDREAPGAGSSERRLVHVISSHATGRVDEHFNLSVAWAGKRAAERSDGFGSAAFAQWLHGRATLDLARGWDVGLTASGLFGDGLASRRHGVGAEIGRQVADGVWLSGGINRFGYDDQELTGEEYTRAGAYLRLRCKFDEDLLLGRPGAQK
jgi:uncharacterized repeat protein (TIGR01451 family)